MKTIAVLFALVAVSAAVPRKPADTGELLRSLFTVVKAQEISDAILTLLEAGEVNTCILYNWSTVDGSPFLDNFLNPLRESEAYQEFLGLLAGDGVDVEEGTTNLDNLLNLNPAACAGASGDVSLSAIGDELAELGIVYPTEAELLVWYATEAEGSQGGENLIRILNMDPSKTVAREVYCNQIVNQIVEFFVSQGYDSPGAIIDLLIGLLELEWEYPPSCTAVHTSPRNLSDLLDGIKIVLNVDALVEAMKGEINSADPQEDLCRVFLWFSGQANGDTAFIDMLVALQEQPSFQEMVAFLSVNGVDTAAIEQAFIDLLTAPTTCVYDGGEANLMNIGPIFQELYPTLDDLLGWLGDNAGNDDFFFLLESISGDSATWQTIDYLSCDPTIQLIIETFITQGYPDPSGILELINSFLGLGWPNETSC